MLDIVVTAATTLGTGVIAVVATLAGVRAAQRSASAQRAQDVELAATARRDAYARELQELCSQLLVAARQLTHLYQLTLDHRNRIRPDLQDEELSRHDLASIADEAKRLADDCDVAFERLCIRNEDDYLLTRAVELSQAVDELAAGIAEVVRYGEPGKKALAELAGAVHGAQWKLAGWIRGVWPTSAQQEARRNQIAAARQRQQRDTAT